jgi:hypothetical protein
VPGRDPGGVKYQPLLCRRLQIRKGLVLLGKHLPSCHEAPRTPAWTEAWGKAPKHNHCKLTQRQKAQKACQRAARWSKKGKGTLALLIKGLNSAEAAPRITSRTWESLPSQPFHLRTLMSHSHGTLGSRRQQLGAVPVATCSSEPV